ncbi:hypothetical protein BC792_12119 [Sphingobacterium allocomposti]|uniref:Bacteriophage CI repressor-like protein n=1 Tax=Sphingobacterium allocomposti TaxID=415956 RepID=A0A5S5D558_9SPHI|nr:hypothetical protein [Sphingobacterium composti Yoo et al. 2007 non Ten et al. 2007]TYP91177.1 hypothetical protein BC792_12119 [Sphingobacterium composti Yoo et al. 2007 non Ten et al. 2007]HLT88233.1 hypothetical protein [Sphingobacterium sp.]
MSNIKERVLQIAERKKISKTDFFKDLGLSYANFKGPQKSTGLNSDAVATILSKHPDINPTWLVIGEGPMYRHEGEIVREEEARYNEPVVVNEIEQTLIDALKLVISSQEKTISSLEKQVTILENTIRILQGK